jgi:KDO2-lipid IV(A) lauroyltransferase
MQILGYFFFRTIVFLFWLLPFSIIYRLSDALAWLLYRVVKYRRKVVEEQLLRAFPDKNAAELQQIAQRSYQNLADIILESFKGFNLNADELRQRYVFKNTELIDHYYQQKQTIILTAAHFANWEWGVLTAPLWVKFTPVGVYKPLSNKYIEAYTAHNRSRFGMELAKTSETSLTIEKNKNRLTAIVMVADQNPSSMAKSHWMRFLNQDTACLIGPEKHARANNYPVVLIDIQRQKRGYYEVTFKPLFEQSASTQPNEITEQIMHEFEKIITAKPQDWLWTHKRWKKKRPTENLTEN